MKLLLALLMTTGAAASGGELTNSGPASGIYAQIALDRTNALSSGNQIHYGFLCTNTDAPQKIIYPKPEYFCRIQLFDANGISMPLTALGATFGGAFAELKEYSRERIEMRDRSGGPVPRFQLVHPNGAVQYSLPSPEQLFVITNRGVYKLKCEFQVFEQIILDPDAQRKVNLSNIVHTLIRLPPLEFPVITPGPPADVEVTNSAPAEGIYVQVGLDRTNALSSDHRMHFGFLCTNTATTRTLQNPTRQYFCRMRLFDPSGRQIPTTVQGGSIGNWFTDLKEYSLSKVAMRPDGGNSYVVRSTLAAWDQFPAPEELFVIPASGMYTLKCEFQVFEQIPEGMNFRYNLIRIPPLEFPVIATVAR